MKQYSLEFRSQLVKEANETRNIAMVARKHNLSVQTVYAWIRKSRAPQGPESRSRIHELEKELESSRLENEILKELLKKTNLAWLGGSPLPRSLSRARGAE